MKRKKRLAVIALAAVLLAAALLAFNTPEKQTLRYFRDHRAVLSEDAAASMQEGSAVNRLKVTANYWNGEHPVLEYTVVCSGIVFANYYGFFYSPDDMPVPFQNAGIPLTPVSDGEWTWHGEGDNHGLVRRLEPNWFYFEASL